MAGRRISRDAVFASLATIAPFPDRLRMLLKMPPQLFDISPPGGYSYSSDPDLPASTVDGCFFVNLPLPDKIPDYAISLSMKGGTMFCTLVDKKRKIIVNAPVSSITDDEPDWGALWLCLQNALRCAKKASHFVLASEDLIEIL